MHNLDNLMIYFGTLVIKFSYRFKC